MILADLGKKCFAINRIEDIEIIEKQVERNPFINKDIKKDKDLILTSEQNLHYILVTFQIYMKYHVLHLLLLILNFLLVQILK